MTHDIDPGASLLRAADVAALLAAVETVADSPGAFSSDALRGIIAKIPALARALTEAEAERDEAKARVAEMERERKALHAKMEALAASWERGLRPDAPAGSLMRESAIAYGHCALTLRAAGGGRPA